MASDQVTPTTPRLRETPSTTHHLIGRLLARLMDGVNRFAPAIVVLALLLTGLLLHYTVSHLGINTDTADMLSERLPWRQTYLAYKQSFPQLFEDIVIVIDGATPDLADQAGKQLADRLAQETNLFDSVYRPGGGNYFERHGLLYLKLDELEDLADSLAQVQPFIGTVIRDQSLNGLLAMLNKALDAVLDGDELDLVPMLDRLGDAFAANADGRFYQLSWQEIMLGRTSTANDRRRFVIVQPQLDFSTLLPGETAMAAIRQSARDLRVDEAHGVRVRLTGSVALENEELNSVSASAELAGLFSLLLVSALLYRAFRSFRLVAAALLTLIVGLIGTAAFATAAIGHLNLISIAFAVLYIGLSTAYAIHLCLRYLELRRQGRAHHEAIREAAGDVGAALVLCAITTAVGFYAFIPTAYTGVSELGLISGTGMFISLLANLVLLPAVLRLLPLSAARIGMIAERGPVGTWLLDAPIRYRYTIGIGAAVIGTISVLLLSKVRFDTDPMNLRDPGTESVATYHELLAESDHSPLTLTILAPTGDDAREQSGRIEALPSVDKAVSLEDFVPADQDDKLAILDEIALLLGPELDAAEAPEPHNRDSRRHPLQELAHRLDAFVDAAGPEQSAAGRRLRDGLHRFESAIDPLPQDVQQLRLDALEESLVAALPERLAILRSSLQAGTVTRDLLPPTLVERWVSRDGLHRIQVFPREQLSDPEALLRFVSEVRTVAPAATDTPVVILEAGLAVVQAFQQAFLLAFIVITGILLALLRRVRDSILVLIPLLLAGLLTGAALVLFGLPFNFANIIALPLLLGIGVDNGIHMVQRARLAAPRDGGLLGTSTARAVIYSALTTIASFGTLAFSSHLGMASMGQLLALGIFLTLLCTLIVLPALLPAPLPHNNPDRSDR